MHNNYYFLRHLSKQLKNEIIGFSVNAIYSQSKNELTLSLIRKNEERFIKAHLSPQFCCLSFPKSLSRARKNSVDLFQFIFGHEINDVVQIENDRSFYFQISGGFQLLFKMHGNRANIILIKDKDVIEIFRKVLKKDYSIKINELSKKISIDKKSFIVQETDYKKLIPTLGSSFETYFEILKYDQLDYEEKYNSVVELITYLNNPNYCVHFTEQKIPELILFRKNENDIAYETPTEALNSFFIKYLSISKIEKEKTSIKNSLLTQIKKIDAYIKKSSARHAKLLNSSNYKRIADLIMANLHMIKPYSEEVRVVDFFTQKPVTISLKPSLTPQLNAEKYYKKAKRQEIEVDTLLKNLENKSKLKNELEIDLKNIDNTANFSPVSKKLNRNQEQVIFPYHKVIYMDYDILIGKNATKNELLTFKMAKKDDLFLHAKNSSGSHVIVRKKAKQNFPKAVIEKAASYAAFYSKMKTESLCAVLYTSKKYVRKAKGAPPGKVIVEKEQVVLVRPEKI